MVATEQQSIRMAMAIGDASFVWSDAHRVLRPKGTEGSHRGLGGRKVNEVNDAMGHKTPSSLWVVFWIAGRARRRTGVAATLSG